MAKTSQTIKKETKKEITGVILIAAAVLLLISLYLVPLEYPGETTNAGAIGSFLVCVLAGITGAGRFIIPVLMAAAGIMIMRNHSGKIVRQKITGLVLLFLSFLAFLHLSVQALDAKSFFAAGVQGAGGGFVGALICWLMQKGFGRIGTMIILTASSTVSLLLITELSLTGIAKMLWERLVSGLRFLKATVFNFIYEEEEQLPAKKSKKSHVRTELPAEPPVIISHENLEHQQQSWEDPQVIEPVLPPVEIVPLETTKKDESSGIQAGNKLSQNQEGEYQLPGTGILNETVKIKNPRISKDITDRIKILEDTLDSFGVKVKVTQVSCGPAVTRYEMQPCPGVKVSKIVSLADDIALNLAAPDVRIEAPVPGKSVIGIEVPKTEISTVGFREMVESLQFTQSISKLTVALGKDITGTPVVADLTSMPHLLIAGATGSGKSVCMNALICSILFKAKPSEVKFMMVDPKMVELTNYNGLPHLISPVITDLKKAAGALKWVVREMENRYSLFASTGVKDLQRFNEVKKDSGEELPQMVVVIDELADLMMVAPSDVEDSICRLAQMARAAGIHLMVATQRPSVDVITGLIKANIPSRIAFAVSSQIDSRTILDMSGAEKLLGRGDMLFNPVGAAKPLRVQGVYLSEDEIASLVEFCRAQAKPEYFEGIGKIETQEPDKPPEDVLFNDAARLVVGVGQASVSMLQRRFRIGYSRAARLVDLLESHGIVGGYEGSKPRNVLMSQEQLENYLREKGE